jgi:hypothetical protein
MITGFDVIIYALGWVVLIQFGWKSGKVLSRVIWAISCGFSVCRWTLHMRRKHSEPRRVILEWAPLLFWASVDCWSVSTPVIRTSWGVWNGIGNWAVFPPKVTP